jgi:hypothetical protein
VRRANRSRKTGSSGFIRSENFTFLAVTASKFGCRPSALALVRDPVLALEFDLAAAARLIAVERAAAETLEHAGAEPDWHAARYVQW